MKQISWITVLVLALTLSTPRGNAATVVQDFEKDFTTNPGVWVSGMPTENVSLQLSGTHPHDGKNSLQLHYHFTEAGQYLGVTIPISVADPVHKLTFWLYGDNSGSEYGMYIRDGLGKLHKYRDPTTRKIDFTGWKEITFALDSNHETEEGQTNRLDFPLSEMTLEVTHVGAASVEGDLFVDGVSVDDIKPYPDAPPPPPPVNFNAGPISVSSPEYCSDIKGDTTITISAPDFKTVTVKCWQQGAGFGKQIVVGEVTLDDKGAGTIVFPADKYPHGPITVTITGDNGTLKDNCYLQLYNQSGVPWSEGIPSTTPPGASGMHLVFEDDFKKMPTIGDDSKSTYYDHKPPNGSQDFSSIPFTSFSSPNNPFSQVDSYLRIRCDASKRSSGLLSSVKNDGSGVVAQCPCYFECRFLGPNAIGTWPAFWLLTNYQDPKFKETKGVDELDIIEAYGGEGPGHPMDARKPESQCLYQITPHAWNQPENKGLEDEANRDVHHPATMTKVGVPSSWFETFHTYGCKITEKDTIYYLDNIEIARHKTLPVSKKVPFFFLINLATGGGWPVNISRYGKVDMYVDYVRVYAGR